MDYIYLNTLICLDLFLKLDIFKFCIAVYLIVFTSRFENMQIYQPSIDETFPLFPSQSKPKVASMPFETTFMAKYSVIKYAC